MNLPELLADEACRRHEFPVCESKIFLAHAGVSPLPRRVTAAMQAYLDAAARDNQEDVVPDRIVGETREMAARLIGATKEEIAFTGSTSMGLAMVAAGLTWQPGDNLVCYREDYPANVYPWMSLAGQGVEIRFVQPRQYGNVTVPDLERVVDGRTRLVALASVHFVSGWRLAVDEIGQFLHERGILFCLDGIQSFGALRTEMRHVDFAAADAHKWLLGPLGIAILYVRREHFERLRPVLVGWHNAVCPDYLARETLTFWPDARRYEPGSLNVAGIVGLHAALQLIRELDLEVIEKHVLSLAGRVIAGVRERGLKLVGPPEEQGRSGIVAFESAGRDLEQLHARLSDGGIVTSLRRRHQGGRCLRISAHCYNQAAEIEKCLKML